MATSTCVVWLDQIAQFHPAYIWGATEFVLSAPGFGGHWTTDAFMLALEWAEASTVPVTVYLERAPRPEEEHVIPELLYQWLKAGVGRVAVQDLDWLPWLADAVAEGLQIDYAAGFPTLGTVRWLQMQGVTRIWLPAWGLQPDYMSALQQQGIKVAHWGIGALSLARSTYNLSTPQTVSSCEIKTASQPPFIWQEQLLGSHFDGGRICLLPLLTLLPELDVWGICGRGRSPEALAWDIHCSHQLMTEEQPLADILQAWANMEAESWLGGPARALRYPQYAQRWGGQPRSVWAARNLEPGIFEALTPLETGQKLEWRSRAGIQELSLPLFSLYDGEQTRRLTPGQCWHWSDPAVLSLPSGMGSQVTGTEPVGIDAWLATWA